MKHYDSFENIKYDGTLLGEEVWAFNKIDGQNFCAKFSPKQKIFTMFGSKTQNVDESSDQFGDAVRYFKNNYSELLTDIIIKNSSKNSVFNGVQEITFFFEWYGENSFSGFHEPTDILNLCLIDVFLYKKGYIEPKTFYKLFYNVEGLEVPEIIFAGKLTKDFVNDIQNNDWTEIDSLYPNVKEGVVCKRTTLMKGQKLPKIKIKTKWWLTKLKTKFPDDWKKFE